MVSSACFVVAFQLVEIPVDKEDKLEVLQLRLMEMECRRRHRCQKTCRSFRA